MPSMTRRSLLATSTAVAGSLVTGSSTRSQGTTPPNQPDKHDSEPFGYCLNTSTIRGQSQGLVETIEIAAKAGYAGIEPWIRDIEQYVNDGGSLGELTRRLSDLGVSVASAIGFAEWIVDEDNRRAQGLEQAKRDMDLVARLGGNRLAAPPAGATRETVNLLSVAERYRALLELGDQMDVVPQVEVWGFSSTLSRLGEALFVAIESRHPQACVLADVYHLYKGGSDFAGLRLLNGANMHLLHVNDYPATPPRSEIGDANRVYPGDGVAPLTTIFRTLRDIDFRGMLSLELFNRKYWKQDPLEVARRGLSKTRQAVRQALA